MTMNRRQFMYAGGSLALATSSMQAFGQSKPPIKVGILHSLSGTMAISESALKETALINRPKWVSFR